VDAATGMLIAGEDLFAFVEAVMWALFRVGAVLMAAPLIGTRSIPMRIRLVLAIAISAALTPLLPSPPPMAVDAATVLNVVRELALGVAMGFVLRLAFEAGSLAGELIAQGMALAFAQMADPLRGGASSGVVGMWFYVSMGLLFFAFDAHLALVELIAHSYSALPVGQPIADPGRIAHEVPLFLAVVLRVGATIAVPVMIAMLVVNLSFGVLSRAAPQMNPIQIGLPAALFMGFTLLVVLTGELAAPVERLFLQAFGAAYGLLG